MARIAKVDPEELLERKVRIYDARGEAIREAIRYYQKVAYNRRNGLNDSDSLKSRYAYRRPEMCQNSEK